MHVCFKGDVSRIGFICVPKPGKACIFCIEKLGCFDVPLLGSSLDLVSIKQAAYDIVTGNASQLYGGKFVASMFADSYDVT
ncbi:hypothetical protein L7F22_047273, partial [Adiantum nelumboides]|nr:hypothetical protein [Adiantum nelumboides]